MVGYFAPVARTFSLGSLEVSVGSSLVHVNEWTGGLSPEQAHYGSTCFSPSKHS